MLIEGVSIIKQTKYTLISRRCFAGMNACFLTSLFASPSTDAQVSSGSSEFESIRDSLVQISDGENIAIGFLLMMEGRPYIVTSTSAISGHDQLSFNLLSGHPVHPKKIELSSTRDLARFLVSEEKGLKLIPDLPENEPVSVPEYLHSNTVHQHPGVITGGSKDMIELSADFSEESRGSPILNSALAVGGVASYLIYYKDSGSGWEGTPRSFAYRLDDAAWYSPNWKTYNRSYGKILRDVDEFRTIIYREAAQWMLDPKTAIETEDSLGLEFDRWVKQQNGMASSLSEKIGKGGRDDANRAIQKDFDDCCNALSELCSAKARVLDFLCNDKKTTPYLKMQFKWRSLELLKFCNYIEAFRNKTSKNRWV